MWRRSLWIRVWVPVALFLMGTLAGLLVIIVVSPPLPITEQTQVTLIRSSDSRVNQYVRPVRSYDVTRINARLSPRERALAEFITRQNYSTRRGTVSVYVEDLTDATAFGFRADETYTPASLLKIPLAMAARSDNNGRYSLSAESMNENSGEYFRSDKRALVAGRQYSFENVLSAMLVSSDNNARTLIAATVGGDNAIKNVFDELQIAYPSADPMLSPRQYAGIIRALVNGTYAGDQQSEYILRLLAESDFVFGMRAGIPSGVPVASKFGEHTVYGAGNQLHRSELHECGVIYAEVRPFILCVMTKGQNLAQQADVIREVSRFVYGLMVP